MRASTSARRLVYIPWPCRGMAPDTAKQHSVFNLAATVAAYLTLNSTLNLMNKWLLGVYGFSFPLLLTSCHMLFSFLILLPFMLREPLKSLHKATLQKQWKGIIGIGLFMAVNIAFNNLSLVQITLSLNQVIRQACICLSSVLSAIKPSAKMLSCCSSHVLCVVTQVSVVNAGLSYQSYAVFLLFSLRTRSLVGRKLGLWSYSPLVL